MVDPAAVAAILWVPDGAMLQDDVGRPAQLHNGRSIYIDGSGAVRFTISSGCEDLVRLVVEHYSAGEWQPRTTQYLNPRLATSFGSGCQIYGGGVIQPDALRIQGPYVQWHGEWENQRGDVLAYFIGGNGQQQSGYAAHIPRSIVALSRRH